MPMPCSQARRINKAYAMTILLILVGACSTLLLSGLISQTWSNRLVVTLVWTTSSAPCRTRLSVYSKQLPVAGTSGALQRSKQVGHKNIEACPYLYYSDHGLAVRWFVQFTCPLPHSFEVIVRRRQVPPLFFFSFDTLPIPHVT